jgi:hypothetical protein
MNQKHSNPAAASVLLQDLENAVATGDEILASLIEHSFQVLGRKVDDSSGTRQKKA